MRRRVRLLASLVAAAALGPSSVAAAWPTYHNDPSHIGYDSTAPESGAISSAWNAALDGSVYAEPLVVGNVVLVATENNTLYALDSNSGNVAWFTHLGSPVRSANLPCGNIDPVGITSTPTVDVGAGVLYAVSLLAQPSMHYELWAVRVSSGAILWHELINPPARPGLPAFNPAIENQRGALTLSAGRVYIPFGGRAGDCGNYRGWLVGAPAAGPSSAIANFELPSPNAAGGFWAPSGPAADGAGNVYITSGNTFCTGGCAFDYSESVLKLTSSLALSDYFVPSNWSSLNAGDTDVGSLGPMLVGSGLIFQVGKAGVAYLLSTSSLGGANHMTPLFSGQVCTPTSDAAFGGSAYDPVSKQIFAPCTNRLEALALNTGGATPTLTSTWHGPAVSFSGPPIVAGGMVWTIDPAGTLYALDVATGTTRFSLNIGSAAHFATPSAGGGRIFVPAGFHVIAVSIGWSPWDPLSGVLKSGPDVASPGSGMLDVFVRGSDDGLWHRSFNSTWGNWQPLGGVVSADPSAVSSGPGHLEVFVRGSTNVLWHQSFNGTAWSGWENLGGVLTSSPDASSWGSTRVDVFGRGSDNALWHRFFNGTIWSAWENLGGTLTADPSAVSWGPNRIDVFVRGTDNGLWHRSFDGTNWSAWDTLGGVLTSGPDASSWTASRLDVFARGTDGGLWQRSFTGTAWGNWVGLGGSLNADPSAVSWASGRIDVFVRGGDSALWHRGFTN